VPELNFKGKEFVYNHHLTVPFRPLEIHADKSVLGGIGEPSLDGNLIIHGDNLHALKALLPMYAGKVDCIFIDPPYNTGKESWCYSDNVNSPMIREWLRENVGEDGKVRGVSKDDGLRHDKWAAMMWPRLRLLHELLAEGGCLALCIGHDEFHRSTQLLEEIFGNQCAGFLNWKSRAKPHNTGDAKVKPQKDTEYVVLFVKGAGNPFRLTVSGEARSYPHEDADGRFRLQTILKSDRGENKRDTMKFKIDGYRPPEGQRWQGGETHIKSLFAKNRAGFFDGTPFLKYYEHEEADEVSPFWCYVDRAKSETSERGKTLLNEICGSDHGLDTVKPLGVVQYVLGRIAGPNALVLDSFAGSGTTAHAVLAENTRDGGKRRFILVEGEDYAERLTAERVRRIIKGYRFDGVQAEELLNVPITFARLKNANAMLEKVQQIETLDGPKFDRIKSTVKDGALVVTGERDCTETAPGLGGTFTYCTLGDAIDMDGLLTGADLPALQPLAALLYHTATAQAFDSSQLVPVPDIGAHVYRLGAANGRHLWLFYKPDLDWLKSAEAALTLSNARAIAATAEGEHLVFAPAKFVSRDLLAAQRLPVEYAPLPYALYRVETA
jgi:adenine-specific DNA-methyltransferase